jgi:multiple sugar transport system substrate-binding protein
MQLDGPWRAASNNAANVNYEAIPLPAGSAGSVSVLGGENFMLFKTSAVAKQEAAWEFVKFMTDKHAQVEMAKVGQMPVNIEALADAEAIAAMPLLPVFATALATAKARPVIASWSEIENVIATKVALAITGQKDVQVAMDECATEINAILAD